MARFVETFEPLRPELYRYCRYLTRNAWDAEDLVQDAFARGLVTMACLFQDICNELELPWRSNGYRYWPLDHS